MSWLAWWNVLFIPGAAGVMFVLLSVIGVGHGQDSHGGSSDAHGDPDAHSTPEGDAGHEGAGHGPEHGEAGGHGHEVAKDLAKATTESDHGILTLLGLGKVPLMIFLTMLFLFFAFIGIGTNLLLAARFPPLVFVPISLASATGGAFFLTAALSRVVAKIVPKEETYAASYPALSGQPGKVVLLTSQTEGYAQIQDKVGNLLELRCQELNGRPLKKDQRVLVTGFDPEKRLCLVVENELEDNGPDR